MLIECEPAIKSIIMHLDSITQDIIIEDIDDCRLVVKENMVDFVKQKLEEVSFLRTHGCWGSKLVWIGLVWMLM